MSVKVDYLAMLYAATDKGYLSVIPKDTAPKVNVSGLNFAFNIHNI